MVRRLVEDMIRRTPVRRIAFVLAVVALAWGMFLFDGKASAAMAMSLVVSYGLGPIVMLQRLQTPLLAYLPVSRRDVWRATWLMSTIAPVTLMTALQLPGTLVNGAAGWSSLTLSTLLDLIYVGAGCALIAAGEAARGVLLRVVMLGLLTLGLLCPIVVRASLPTQWADVGSTHLVLFAIGLAFTLWGAFQTPRTARARPFGSSAASSPVATGPARRERLFGLPRLVAHELAASLSLGAAMMCVFLGMAFVFERWWGREATVRGFLTAQTLLIFDAGALQAPRRFDVAQQFGWYAFYAAAVSIRFPQLLRHLRILPIGDIRLKWLLVAWPALVWSAVWLLLACVHVIVIGRPLTAGGQGPLLVAFIGLSALGIAVALRFQKLWPQAVPLMFFIPFSRLPTFPGVWLTVVGGLSIGLAMAINGNALSRSATYKRTDLLPGKARGL